MARDAVPEVTFLPRELHCHIVMICDICIYCYMFARILVDMWHKVHGWFCRCWQCGSVVRTSVFGWQTFSYLCLIYGWHVTNQPNSGFHPFRVGIWVLIHVITWITEVKTISGRPGLCMAIRCWPKSVGADLAYEPKGYLPFWSVTCSTTAAAVAAFGAI